MRLIQSAACSGWGVQQDVGALVLEKIVNEFRGHFHLKPVVQERVRGSLPVLLPRRPGWTDGASARAGQQ